MVGHRLIFEERLFRTSALFERTRVKQMPFGRLVIGPARSQRIECGDGFLGMTKSELRARLAERIDRLVAHRQRQDVVVVALRLVEFSEFEALFGERGAVGDRIGDFELIGEQAIVLLRIERVDDASARLDRKSVV